MLGFSPLTVQSPARLLCITMWDLTVEQAGEMLGACETAVPEESLPVTQELQITCNLSGYKKGKVLGQSPHTHIAGMSVYMYICICMYICAQHTYIYHNIYMIYGYNLSDFFQLLLLTSSVRTVSLHPAEEREALPPSLSLSPRPLHTLLGKKEKAFRTPVKGRGSAVFLSTCPSFGEAPSHFFISEHSVSKSSLQYIIKANFVSSIDHMTG